jgi:hypothetical protein
MVPINLEFLDTNDPTVNNVSVMSLAIGQRVRLSIAHHHHELAPGIQWFSDSDAVLDLTVADDKLSAIATISKVGLSHILIGKLIFSPLEFQMMAIVVIKAKSPAGQQAVELKIIPGIPVPK